MGDVFPVTAPSKPSDKGKTAEVDRHLRLVEASPEPSREEPPDLRLDRFVRAARRDMMRLVRGIQASGRSLSGWPHEVLTRLAHVDALTARHLLEPQMVEPKQVLDAANGMRALERWIIDRLSVRELADVRARELMIRVGNDELMRPLARPDATLGEELLEVPEVGGVHTHTLAYGLESTSDGSLENMCHRLGVRVRGMDDPDPETRRQARRRAERAVVRTLRDSHLLGILVSTLAPEAQRLLAAVVRNQLEVDTLAELALEHPVATAVGEAVATRRSFQTPAQALRGCGLAFTDTPLGPRLWVPMDLEFRLDGVLRSLGV